ncbi:thiamine diphosphokinase [Sporolactobacillus terrae]|uniref:thiamine diphosphokinase n=1 Tax=Sporolactobacillus terrae TaxID=269673 RepID=UPI00048AC47F|nr:thiamine diphosphokinase [Sporolactobacillus terrae]UAK17095.1 thiamine diphosphokinase [Sporolactobacillus terrae]
MKLAIVAGGPDVLVPDLRAPEYSDYDWIGADHGTIVLLRQKIKPMIAFGDFDSLSDEEREEVNGQHVLLVSYAPEKDKTDLELALDWALNRKPEHCLIFGATGGRMDHTLASVQLLMKAVSQSVDVAIVDKNNRITLLTPGTYPIRSNSSYRYLSFLALTEKVVGLTLSGLKYPLQDAVLPLGSSRCISNETEEDSFTVSFSKGCLLMMQCRD